jgi:hypothetical protein
VARHPGQTQYLPQPCQLFGGSFLSNLILRVEIANPLGLVSTLFTKPLALMFTGESNLDVSRSTSNLTVAPAGGGSSVQTNRPPAEKSRLMPVP